MPSERPNLLHLERLRFLLEGAVQSRSDPERIYQPRVLLQANFLCTCAGSQLRDSLCTHLKELIESMPVEELRAWIYDAQVIPEPIT